MKDPEKFALVGFAIAVLLLFGGGDNTREKKRDQQILEAIQRIELKLDGKAEKQ